MLCIRAYILLPSRVYRIAFEWLTWINIPLIGETSSALYHLLLIDFVDFFPIQLLKLDRKLFLNFQHEMNIKSINIILIMR